jgi:hypothetical protein
MRGGAVTERTVLAGLQQCKSFVEMCSVSCLRALSACLCGWGAATWGCPRRHLPCRRDSLSRSTAPTVAGCRLVGCSVVI